MQDHHSAVQIKQIDGRERPSLELSAQTWELPISTTDELSQIIFKMKVYRPYEVKSFYDDLLTRRKALNQAERLVQTPDFTAMLKFLDNHFVEMIGVVGEDDAPLDTATQKQWLDSPTNLELKQRIFTHGYDAISRVESAETKASKKVVLLFSVKEHAITCKWRLHNLEREMNYDVLTTHRLDRINQQQKEQYSKAISLIENSRSAETFVQANWDVVEQLYDHTIKAVEGACIEGEPCEEKNKAAWLPLVPFLMKVFVMGRAMSALDLKNG